MTETIDIPSLLFSENRDFLITNDARRQVTFEDLRGKIIVIHMLSLTDSTGPNLSETFHLMDTYNELCLKRGFEVVFVPVMRGRGRYRASCKRQAEKRFKYVFSKMPWPAIPFSDQIACDRICNAFRYPSIILSPKGTVLKHCSNRFFNYYGGPDCPLGYRKVDRIDDEEEAILEGMIDLNQILATPCRDFLLTKDGNKVPISSLQNKVVGLYFCDNLPSPPRMEVIKKVYQQARDLGHDFEIVQVTFHFPNNCRDLRRYIKDVPMKPCCENIPWLTLPFKDPCGKRLRRIFKCHRGKWSGDRLVIVSPHEPNIIGKGTFFDFYGADIVQHFGIEAYPFTRDKVIELEHTRRKQELKLQHFLGPPLLRHRGGGEQGCDQVPVSRLWGKNVLILVADHSKYETNKLAALIKSKYDGGEKFEVVYISKDPDGCTFDECTKKMPWLVHPYSLESADLWMSKFFTTKCYYYQCGAMAAFDLDGELMAKIKNPSARVHEYPFMEMELQILQDAARQYGIDGDFNSDLSEDSDSDSD